MSENSKTALKAAIVATLMAGLFAATAQAGNGKGGANNDGLDTPADTIHPSIHANNNEGNNANPNGQSPNSDVFAVNTGGGNMHGIANTPGQLGTNPNDDGVSGFANSLNTVHGGINSKNKNVIP